MALSYFIPIIGGLIVYLLKKDEDKNLANICLIGSVVHPILIGLLVGVIEVFLGLIYDPLFISLLGWAAIIIIGLAFNWYAIKSIFPDNEYRYFLTVFWFSFFGAIYSYYYAYKENEFLKNNVGWFFFFQLVFTILFSFANSMIAYMLLSGGF